MLTIIGSRIRSIPVSTLLLPRRVLLRCQGLPLLWHPHRRDQAILRMDCLKRPDLRARRICWCGVTRLRAARVPRGGCFPPGLSGEKCHSVRLNSGARSRLPNLTPSPHQQLNH